MSSTDEKIGQLLGKFDTQSDYIKQMNHDIRDNMQATQAAMMELREHMDESHEELKEGQRKNAERLAVIENRWSLMKAIGKWVGGILTAVGITWFTTDVGK